MSLKTLLSRRAPIAAVLIFGAPFLGMIATIAMTPSAMERASSQGSPWPLAWTVLPAMIGFSISVACILGTKIWALRKLSQIVQPSPGSDPMQAIEDAASPLARASGRLERKRLEAMGVDVGKIAERLSSGNAPSAVVKVRCKSCTALNDEHAKFCQQCGKPV